MPHTQCEQFPDGHIRAAAFEAHGARWELHARAVADGRRVVHLALPATGAAPSMSAAAGAATPPPPAPLPPLREGSSSSSGRSSPASAAAAARGAPPPAAGSASASCATSASRAAPHRGDYRAGGGACDDGDTCSGSEDWGGSPRAGAGGSTALVAAASRAIAAHPISRYGGAGSGSGNGGGGAVGAIASVLNRDGTSSMGRAGAGGGNGGGGSLTHHAADDSSYGGGAYDVGPYGGDSGGMGGVGGVGGGGDGGGGQERRKYVRDIVAATNPAADALSRYKALTALIEHCKARARALRPGPHTDWAREPARSLLHEIVDVGEALAGFGNAQLPERSGEARAVLAADYRALLSEYLKHLGGALAPGAVSGGAGSAGGARRGLAPEAEAELRAVAALLATRCEAYKVLYDRLVGAVGPAAAAHEAGGGRGGGRGGSGSDAPVLIFNTNTNTVTASPVTHNVNAADARSSARARLISKRAGIGAAAAAAAALAIGLLVRALRNNGGDGNSERRPRRRCGDGESGGSSEPRRRMLPRGKGGRETALISALAACGDELRKAAANDTLLHDDWRLGRALRLAWPPAPEPPGYAPLAMDACDVTGVLRDLYGRW